MDPYGGCGVQCLKEIWRQVADFLLLFARESFFVTSYLLSCTLNLLRKDVFSKRKEFIPKGTSFFVSSYSGPVLKRESKIILTELPPLKVYPGLFFYSKQGTVKALMRHCGNPGPNCSKLNKIVS